MAQSITKGTSWHSAPMMKMITEAEPGRRRGARRRNQTPRDNDSICSPQSADDRAPRGGLAGLVVKGTLKSTTSPPMSFSHTPNKAKAAADTEKPWEWDSPSTPMTPATVELRMPTTFYP